MKSVSSLFRLTYMHSRDRSSHLRPAAAGKQEKMEVTTLVLAPGMIVQPAATWMIDTD